MRCRWLAPVALLVVAVATPWPSAAQTEEEPLPGLEAHDDSQPIEVTADELEVRQNESIATFRGNVDAVQGTMTLTSDLLDVYYGDPPAEGTEAAPPPAEAGAGSGRIRKVVAIGNVVVTSPRDIATGDEGVYDLSTRTITLTGDVVLTRDENVVRGNRLVVDMDTGVSRVFPAEAGGRVRALFVPGEETEG
ncbi:MAG: LptA/OstA family protein [Pseudomonadota bacterium]